MQIKEVDNNYYDEQNKRSGSNRNSNTLFESLKAANIRVQSGWKTFDIGCRSGFITNELYRRGCDVCGIDIGESAKKQWIQNKYPFITQLYCGDIHKFNLPKDYFNLITISHALEHLYDPVFVLNKMISSIKPGGLIHSIVPIEPKHDFEKYPPHLVRFENHEDHCNFYLQSGLKKVYDYYNSRERNSTIIVKKDEQI